MLPILVPEYEFYGRQMLEAASGIMLEILGMFAKALEMLMNCEFR
jgi:hypothetical protein